MEREVTVMTLTVGCSKQCQVGRYANNYSLSDRLTTYFSLAHNAKVKNDMNMSVFNVC